MGTVKTAAKKKPSKKSKKDEPRFNIEDTFARLVKVEALIGSASEHYACIVESVHPQKEHFTQQHMESALLLDLIIEHAKFARKKFDEEALTHHSFDGRFEHGRVAVTFPLTKGRRNTKWKNVATEKARELAEEQGEGFNAEDFDLEVKNDTDYTTVGEDKTTVKLTESAG